MNSFSILKKCAEVFVILFFVYDKCFAKVLFLHRKLHVNGCLRDNKIEIAYPMIAKNNMLVNNVFFIFILEPIVIILFVKFLFVNEYIFACRFLVKLCV